MKEPCPELTYRLIGNVSEWTISGSDPLFFVMGDSHETEKERCMIDTYAIYHAKVKMGSIGLRLVYYPKVVKG